MTSVLESSWALFERIYSALLSPASFISDPSKRIYWSYLIVSVVMAGVVLVMRYRRRGLNKLYTQLLSPRLWLHPSSLLDIKLMLVKSLVRTLLFIPWLISSYGLAVSVVRYASRGFGVAAPTQMSASMIAILYTIVLFVSSDLSRYLLHRLCHRIPILWQFHQVHHSAEVMTPLTLYRSHPVENLLYMIRGVVVTGCVTGLFFYYFGARAVQYQFLGVNMLGFLFNCLGANLRHSHVWISYGSFIERILLSPAQHQIHHSVDPRHYGANYGSCLAVWDALGGSLHIPENQEKLRFGLPQDDVNHESHALGSALAGPFVASWRLMRARSSETPVTLDSPRTVRDDDETSHARQSAQPTDHGEGVSSRTGLQPSR